MDPVRVEKATGEVFGLFFHFWDYVEGRVEQYYAPFQEVDVMMAFADRVSQGQEYSIKWQEDD